MDKSRIPFGDIRESSGEKRASSFSLSPMVGWFKLIVNHIVFVKDAIFVIYSIESSRLLSEA